MDYREIFQRFSKLNILIIGDVMIDSYMWGKVERISPEAPVPICTVAEKENRLGGAANVALNIAAMDAEPVLCSVVGNDENGKLLTSLMNDKNMSLEGIVFSDQRKTTIKTRVLSGSSQMLRIDEETDSFLSMDEEDKFLNTIFQILNQKRIDAIVFQDYDKGVITKNIIDKVVEKSSKMNIPTTIDPKKRNFSYYKGVTLFKPNVKELKEGLKIDFEQLNEETLLKAALLLHDKQSIEKVFITLSEKGIFMVDFSTEPFKIYLLPAYLRAIADVSGAGDTVISLATLCLALKLDAHAVAQISNLAGGLVCESVGVVPIDKNRLFFELNKIK
jgi:rfaE bifunctional protein kinase chain/domain